jgi:pyruvate formate lyase activating enzyme
MEGRISSVQSMGAVDGPGLRYVVFMQGCPLRCKYCHNPETWDRCGTEYTPSELLEKALRYKAYWGKDFKNGGVTLSGGEPLLQADGVAELAKALQGRGISVLLDTAGCVPWSRFEAVLPYVDTVFFDWKTSDPTVMKERLGGDLPLIKSNLARLLRTAKDTHIRIPLIPAVNTDAEQVCAMIRDLCEIGARTVALLPFHRLAAGKYEAMGIPYPYRDTPPLPADTLRRAVEILSKDFTVYTEK